MPQILTYNGMPIDCGSHIFIYSLLPKTWTWAYTRPSTFNAKKVWLDADATHCYYSDGDTQLRLTKSTSTWNGMVWSGTNNNLPKSSNFSENIWHMSGNTYYSGGGSNGQYRLDSLNGWVSKTWQVDTGMTVSMDGMYIWTDGTTFYHSSNSNQRRYDETYFKWKRKSWSGISSFKGNNVWTDGLHTYCYYDGYTYILSGSTWTQKTFSGFNSIDDVSKIWHYGDKTFYSTGSAHYMLDPLSFTWNQVDFGANFSGSDVWTDGDGVYVGADYEISITHPEGYTFIRNA